LFDEYHGSDADSQDKQGSKGGNWGLAHLRLRGVLAQALAQRGFKQQSASAVTMHSFGW
jgi:hypothetical protein